jgi:hypothetical protein
MLYYTALFAVGVSNDRLYYTTAKEHRDEWRQDARLHPNDKRAGLVFRTDPSVDWSWIAKRYPAYWEKLGDKSWAIREDWEQMAAADGYIKLPDVGGDEPAAEDEEHDDDCTCGVCEDDFTNAGERAME